MMRKPCFMAAVHTCTVLAPRSMNSTASFHVLMPPMPDTGTFRVVGSWLIVARNFKAIGFTAGPQYPPKTDLPATYGFGIKVSRSMPVTDCIVLIKERALDPASTAA